MLGALPVALAATVGIASPAVAMGGGTGGGATVTTPSCAYFNSWTTSLETLPGETQPRVALRVGVFNGCVDEGAGAKKGLAVDETFTDTATGAWLGATVYMGNLGQNTFTYYFTPGATNPSPVTLTFTVTRPNGQLQDSRTTTAAEIIASAQPAA
jgi:hypothetical protein